MGQIVLCQVVLLGDIRYLFVYVLCFQKQLAEEKARFAEAAAKRKANDDEGFSKLPNTILRVRQCRHLELEGVQQPRV